MAPNFWSSVAFWPAQKFQFLTIFGRFCYFWRWKRHANQNFTIFPHSGWQKLSNGTNFLELCCILTRPKNSIFDHFLNFWCYKFSKKKFFFNFFLLTRAQALEWKKIFFNRTIFCEMYHVQDIAFFSRKKKFIPKFSKIIKSTTITPFWEKKDFANRLRNSKVISISFYLPNLEQKKWNFPSIYTYKKWSGLSL